VGESGQGDIAALRAVLFQYTVHYAKTVRVRRQDSGPPEQSTAVGCQRRWQKRGL